MNDWVLSLRSIANGTRPVTDISNILKNHDCLYLLSKLDDEGIVKRAKIDCDLISLWTKTYYTQCKPIFMQLEEHGILYAVIKGPLLSEMAYKKPYFRKFSDIDILISKENVNEMKSILFSEEFVQGQIVDGKISLFSREDLIYQAMNSHQLAPFVKPTGNPFCPFVTVDVNFDIMWGEFQQYSNMKLVLEQIESVVFMGTKIKKLNKEMEFIIICLHHYKDMNSIYLLWKGKGKLALFSDILYYLRNNKLNVKKLKELSKMLSISEYIYYCIYFTNELFADPSLSPYLSSFYSEKATLLLNTYGLSKSETKEWHLDFFDRLSPDIVREYFSIYLTENDKEKIKLNDLHM